MEGQVKDYGLGTRLTNTPTVQKQQGQIQDALNLLKKRADETQKAIDAIYELIVMPDVVCDSPPPCDPRPIPLTVVQKIRYVAEQTDASNNKLDTLATILREKLGEEFLI